MFSDDVSYARYFLVTGENGSSEHAKHGPCSHRACILMKQVDECSNQHTGRNDGFYREEEGEGVVQSGLAATFD